MGKKTWASLSNSPESLVNELIKKISLPRPIALFLAARNVQPEEVDRFIKPSLNRLSDPYRFPGIEKAAERIWLAIRNRELILIHGDYDTDGITATALLAHILRDNGAEVFTFLPHRFDDGYGFTPETLHKAIESASQECKLLITVDCGTNSVEAVEEANNIGIDVVITDHHEPGPEIPEAIAVINPKMHDSLKDLQVLSGAGAAFKLCHAFLKFGRENNFGGFTTELSDILDLVALGTIADIVPLLGENRILVKHGLKILRKQLRPGVRALFEMAKVKPKLKASDITYKLAPRINAAGRLGDANTALELLDAENIVNAYRYAEMLEKYNVERQEKEQEIYQQAREQIEQKIDVNNFYSIVVAGENWHQGVIGIVASRLARDYNRPVIVLTIQNGEAHGSGRSMADLNLVEALSSAKDLLTRFGGHPMAVGLGLPSDKIDVFYRRLEDHISHQLSRADLIEHQNYDGIVEFRELDEEFFNYLELLSPFGHSNTQPVFRINQLETVRKNGIGKKHCRGILRDRHNEIMDFIAFNRPVDSFPRNDFDIIAIPQMNEYGYERKPQLQIVDFQPSY